MEDRLDKLLSILVTTMIGAYALAYVVAIGLVIFVMVKAGFWLAGA